MGVADALLAAEDDLLAFAGFPKPHWRRIWSTNPLERVNTEFKRRSNVVGIFPDDAAVLRARPRPGGSRSRSTTARCAAAGWRWPRSGRERSHRT